MVPASPGQLNTAQINHTDLPTVEGNQREPVLLVGMHNSGTSILAEVLHKSGIFLGANMSHYESHFFSIYINDLLIMEGKGNWAKLPIMSVKDVMSFVDTVGPFIKKHWIADYLQWGYDGVSKWGIKDPRLCVLLPLYLEVFPEAKVVHIRRDSNDVSASLCERVKMGVGKFDNFEHWKQLSSEYVERVLEYSNVCNAYHELTYENFCTKSEETIQEVFDFLGLSVTPNTEVLLSKITQSRIGSHIRREQKRTLGH